MGRQVIDPNTLLNNIRNAIGLGHPAIAMVAFATLDEQLTNGGQPPEDWSCQCIDCSS